MAFTNTQLSLVIIFLTTCYLPGGLQAPHFCADEAWQPSGNWLLLTAAYTARQMSEHNAHYTSQRR